MVMGQRTNPKAEGRNPKEGRDPKLQPAEQIDSDFGFGFRPSDLGKSVPFRTAPQDLALRTYETGSSELLRCLIFTGLGISGGFCMLIRMMRRCLTRLLRWSGGRIWSARAAVVRNGRRLVTWAMPWISCNNFIMLIRVAIRNLSQVIARRVPPEH